ncbi:MAG: transporter substrate-binding domain-containing protein [Fretibacterium sp.]|nr:transporter substrate-binding domain-containing protein [Fretibacterium sp.]
MKKSGHTHLFAWIAATALILAAAAGAVWVRNAGRTDAPVSDGSLQKILNSGRLVLGVDANFPPMSFVEEDEDIVGFDVDMFREVCKRLGVELIRRSIDWDDKEEELNGGTIDCIGSMSVTPESARVMNLSEPYIKETLTFVVPGNSSARWLRDLKGRKIGVQAGSTTQEALEKLDIYKDITPVLFDDNLTILRQLKTGDLDAGLVDSVAAYYFIYSSSERYFFLPENLGEEKFAIGFRKNDKELRNRVQEILSEMKADGSLGKISKKCFGSDITIVR